tara:strand:+ start:794 stop:979 length:186 start_codon:yes stop_codon:yes gene_type:complete
MGNPIVPIVVGLSSFLDLRSSTKKKTPKLKFPKSPHTKLIPFNKDKYTKGSTSRKAMIKDE